MKKVAYQILISLLCLPLINDPVFAKSNTSKENKDSTKTNFSLFSKKPKNKKSEIIITKSHKSIDLAKFISEFKKNKTRILGEDHIKAQSTMLENIKKLEEEIKTLTEPEKKYQKEKRLSELKTLTQNDMAIELDSESKEIDPIIKCNLLYIGNSKASLIHTLFNFLDSNFKSQFIFGKNTIPEILKQNPKLEEALNDLLLYLTTIIEPKGSYEASLSTLLKEIYSIIEQCPQFSTDSLFQKFGQYIHGMKEFYKAQVAKNLADQIIERIKPNIESQLQKKTRGVYYGSTTPISVGPASVKISSTTSFNEEVTDGSFFEVSCSNKYTISVNVGFQKLLANFGVTLGWELTASALMFSIYEVIDTGQLRTSILSGEIKKEAKKGVKLRKEVQLREKQLLAIFPQYIEGFLKTVPIIPLSVPLEWPKITRVKNQESRAESNKFIEADLSLFDMLGFTVKYFDKSIIYSKFQEFSSFIMPDCYPAEGYTADSITKFFGQKYNLFDKYMNEKNNEYGIAIILGDLRKYISALTNLAQNSSDKDAKNTKHEIENRWIGKKLFNSEGRKGVFKSMLVTLMNLRMKCKTDREIELCSQAYVELERLSQMQEFAKGTRRADFALRKKSKSKNDIWRNECFLLWNKFST